MNATLHEGRRVFITVATFGSGRSETRVHTSLERAKGYAQEFIDHAEHYGVRVDVALASGVVAAMPFDFRKEVR